MKYILKRFLYQKFTKLVIKTYNKIYKFKIHIKVIKNFFNKY